LRCPTWPPAGAGWAPREAGTASPGERCAGRGPSAVLGGGQRERERERQRKRRRERFTGRRGGGEGELMGSVTEWNGVAARRFGVRRAGADEGRATVDRRARSEESGMIGAAADQAANPCPRQWNNPVGAFRSPGEISS